MSRRAGIAWSTAAIGFAGVMAVFNAATGHVWWAVVLAFAAGINGGVLLLTVDFHRESR